MGFEQGREQPLDKLYIRDLLLRCVIGVNPEERDKKQDVLINIELFADLSAASSTDAIEETVDYRAIKQGIIAMVEPSSFRLVERLAEEVARICLRDPKVQEVRVCIDKPGALRFARSVGTEIVRRRESPPPGEPRHRGPPPRRTPLSQDE
jgi:D-erythro-7,8-dihydroneopterin triphosphate epimerase